MISLGIDIGSRNTKLVVYDSSEDNILFSDWLATDVNPLKSVNILTATAITSIGYDNIVKVACTGYGRKLCNHKVFSEISCHAAGVLHYLPQTRTIIDIGGQDSKIITLDSHAKVSDFVMNDKCAAGTGRFLETTALRLACSLEQLSFLASESRGILDISSTCVVFAESEIVGMIADNASPADIARAVHNSIAKRIQVQMSALDWQPPVAFTGGVALNSDLALCLSNQLQTEVLVPSLPQITGALGAAILVSK